MCVKTGYVEFVISVYIGDGETALLIKIKNDVKTFDNGLKRSGVSRLYSDEIDDVSFCV